MKFLKNVPRLLSPAGRASKTPLPVAVILTVALVIAGSVLPVSVASAQTTTGQYGVTANFCTNLSLGGPRTYPYDSNGDGTADVCSLPSTRREAIARQNALEQLAQQEPTTYLIFVIHECRLLHSEDFGDDPLDLAKDVCATNILTPLPGAATQPALFHSGVINSPSFCANLSLGGPRTYPYDSNGDGVADICSLPYTRREAIARQNAYPKLSDRFPRDFDNTLLKACSTLIQQGTDFGDNPADLAKDICSKLLKMFAVPTTWWGGYPIAPPSVPTPQPTPTPTPTPQPNVPTSPAAPSLTHGNASLGVSWTQPSANTAAITDYDVRYCADSTGCDTASEWTALDDTGNNATSTATTASITGLTNGTVYQVQVRAGNSDGDGPWSPSATEKPSTMPGKPAAPTLAVHHQGLGVEWSAPSSTGGSDVTGYKVGHCSASCGTDSNWTDTTLNSTDTTTTLSGLTNGTAYQVRVAATNRSGTGEWSDPATATPARVPDAPGAPTLTEGAHQLSVSWTAPSSNGGDISDYDVRYRIKDTDQNTSGDQPGSWTSHTHTGTTTTATITGLTGGTMYQVQVRASNSMGPGAWSSSANAAPEGEPAAPAAPSLDYDDESLTARWTAPADNGQTITDYDVRHSSDGGTSWTELDDTGNNATSTATTASITGLTNGTTYQVQVRAGNSIGDGPWSPSAMEMPSTMPGKPAAPTLAVKNTGLGVSWSAPSSNGGSAVTGYKVRHCVNSTGCDAPNEWTTKTLTNTNTTTDITGLTNNTAYQVQVAAVNRSGTGEWSDPATATPAGVPSKPGAPRLTHGNASLLVEWTAPSHNGAAITGYRVRHCVNSTGCDAASEWTNKDLTGTGTSTTLSTLTNGTAYQVQVRAVNSMGNGPFSDSATEKPSTGPGAPGTPSLTVKDESLGVEWSAPSTTGGADITRYKIGRCSASCGTDSSWTVTTLNSTDTTTTLSGLTNGTAYQVRVAATNRSDTGAWSTSATATPAKAPAAPGAPTLIEGARQLSVSWTAPADNGQTITDYDVRNRIKDTNQNQSGDQPGSWTTLTGSDDPGTTTAATITGLTNGTDYQVQVRATNSEGTSEWSTSATAAPRDKPAVPNPSVHIGDRTLEAVWTAPANNGSAITGYGVQYRVKDTDTTTPGDQHGLWTSHTHTGTTTTTTISSLTNGTAYQVQVRATNNAGTSEWSSSVTATPGTKPLKPALTVTSVSGDVTLVMETTFATAIERWQWQFKTNQSNWFGPYTITTTNKKHTVVDPNPPGSIISNIPYQFRARVCASTCPSSPNTTNSTTSVWVTVTYTHRSVWK